MKPKFIVMLVAVLLLLIILIQNTHVVNLNLLFWSISMSQVILILFTVVIGFIIGYIAALLAGGSRRRF